MNLMCLWTILVENTELKPLIYYVRMPKCTLS